MVLFRNPAILHQLSLGLEYHRGLRPNLHSGSNGRRIIGNAVTHRTVVRYAEYFPRFGGKDARGRSARNQQGNQPSFHRAPIRD